MYIKSYESTRFAGLKDISLGFDRGVNVILGPNESLCHSQMVILSMVKLL